MGKISEELLLALAVKNSGGGGGGTGDYNQLENLPQIGGNTLKGNKSASDLGLVAAENGKVLSSNDYTNEDKAIVGGVTAALAGKQDALTAGDYIDITNGEISVNREIPASNYSYEIVTKSTGGNDASVTIKKYANGTLVSSTDYIYNQTGTVNVDGYFTFQWASGWRYTLLQASTTHAEGYTASWSYLDAVDFTEVFPTEDTSGLKLVIKSELDSAISSAYHHAGTKTCAELVAGLLVAGNVGNVYNITDSGTTTADFIEGAGQPIKAGDNVGIAKISDGVYKFDLLSGFVDTTNFVQKSQTAGLLKNDGTVNEEIEGDVDTLKDDVNALDSKIDDSTTYPYADVITINDAIPANVADCNVKIEPVQDLHGYDHPWVGGAGKNKVKPNSASYKSDSYDGTVFDNPIEGAGVIEDTTLPAGTYTMSIKMLSLPNAGRTLACFNRDNTSETFANFQSINNYTIGQVYSQTFTISSETVLRFRLWGSGGGEFKIQMQLEAGETATDYAPYENICSISGHTEASVQRDGVNLFDGVKYLEGQYYQNGTKYVNANYDVYKFVLPVGNYVIKHIDSTSGLTNMVLCIDIYNSNGDILNYYQTNYNSGNPAIVQFSVDAETAYVYISIRKSAEQVQLEIGTQPTPYEPYKGKTYTIAIGDTIYGGTVNFDSGVMTVDRASVDLGTLTYSRVATNTEGKIRFKADLTNAKPVSSIDEKPNALCSEYDTVTPNDTYACIDGVTIGTTGDFRAYVDAYNNSSASDFKTAMDGVQFCYELATPFTVQLTPQQIQLLKGTNTLTASTGQISVTVNGVSGAIGQVQEQVNDHEERIEAVESGLIDVNVALDVPANAGKNRLLLTLADIKSANTSGTWENNVYTVSNCTFTVNTDADGKVISITAANAATVPSYVLLNIPMPKDDNNYLFNGGASSNYEIFIWDKTESARAKKWDGTTNSVTSTGSDFNEVKNVKDHNLLLVCRIGTNSPAGSGTFYPMVCPANITDPTFAPYIPSVESRLKALEAALAQIANG